MATLQAVRLYEGRAYEIAEKVASDQNGPLSGWMIKTMTMSAPPATASQIVCLAVLFETEERSPPPKQSHIVD